MYFAGRTFSSFEATKASGQGDACPPKCRIEISNARSRFGYSELLRGRCNRCKASGESGLEITETACGFSHPKSSQAVPERSPPSAKPVLLYAPTREMLPRLYRAKVRGDRRGAPQKTEASRAGHALSLLLHLPCSQHSEILGSILYWSRSFRPL